MSYLWKKYLLHPTNPWEEDSVYKAQKIFKPKSPISAFEEMLRMMMMQMGQKPSQKKINQMMTMMNKNQDDAYYIM